MLGRLFRLEWGIMGGKERRVRENNEEVNLVVYIRIK